MDNLSTIILTILGLLGYGLYYKNKADNAKKDAILGETKGEDKQLSKQQQHIENQIKQVENRDDSKLTPEERANRWNK